MGRHLFKMAPIDPAENTYQGICYEIDRQGDFQEIWKTAPWYCGNGHLGPNGRFFVRRGPWAEDTKELSDLAVAFYDKGKLLKEYKVADLLQHPKAVSLTASHYSWQAFEMTTPNEISGSTFHLTLIDNTTYTFNITTGEILKKGRDDNASGPRGRKFDHRDIDHMKNVLNSSEGTQKRFSRLFKAEWPNLDAVLNHPYSEEAPSLEFQFTPKERLLGPAVIHGIQKETTATIQPTLKPEDYLHILKAALGHPDVIAKSKLNQIPSLRLKTSFTHPHQDSATLQKLYREVYQKDLPNEDLSQWVEFDFISIKPKPPFFLNRVTGKILSLNDHD